MSLKEEKAAKASYNWHFVLLSVCSIRQSNKTSSMCSSFDLSISWEERMSREVGKSWSKFGHVPGRRLQGKQSILPAKLAAFKSLQHLSRMTNMSCSAFKSSSKSFLSSASWKAARGISRFQMPSATFSFSLSDSSLRLAWHLKPQMDTYG